MKGKNIFMALLAGGLFAGGLAAPDSWRSAVQGKIASLTGQQPAAKSEAGETPAQAGSPKSEKKKSPPPVPFAAIRRPLALAKGQKLGLGLNRYTDQEAANTQIEQVAALGYVTHIVALQDRDKDDVWYLLIAGEYDNENAAQRAQAILKQALGLEQVPEIVLIPPPPKK